MKNRKYYLRLSIKPKPRETRFRLHLSISSDIPSAKASGYLQKLGDILGYYVLPIASRRQITLKRILSLVLSVQERTREPDL